MTYREFSSTSFRGIRYRCEPSATSWRFAWLSELDPASIIAAVLSVVVALVASSSAPGSSLLAIRALTVWSEAALISFNLMPNPFFPKALLSSVFCAHTASVMPRRYCNSEVALTV